MKRQQIRMLLPLAAAAGVALIAPSVAAKGKEKASAVKMIHASRASVESITGKPYGITPDDNPDHANDKGVFCYYRYHGDEWMILFLNGKAVSVDVTFTKPYKTSTAALAAAGIDIGKRRASAADSEGLSWRGDLFPNGVKFVAVVCDKANQWDAIEVFDNAG